MQYFGGKQRIAKRLVSEVIQPLLDSGSYTLYAEPFAGSCNVISQVKFDKRLASDIDPYIIATLEAASKGCIFPESIGEDTYKSIKAEPESYPEDLVGFVGYGCSFGAKWFGGYARSPKSDRNYAAEASRSLKRKGELLKGTGFHVGDYRELFNLLYLDSPALIYCDIPYAETTGYKSGDFDHQQFYAFAQELARKGHTILVSEYEHNAIAAGQGDRIVWKTESKQDMRSKDGKRKSTVEVVIRFG